MNDDIVTTLREAADQIEDERAVVRELVAALKEAEAMLKVAMRADLNFPTAERNEIIANHPGIKQIRAALAKAGAA